MPVDSIGKKHIRVQMERCVEGSLAMNLRENALHGLSVGIKERDPWWPPRWDHGVARLGEAILIIKDAGDSSLRIAANCADALAGPASTFATLLRCQHSRLLEKVFVADELLRC
jgi:hypothetical protein